MHLAGQGTVRSSPPRRLHLDDGGYIMVVLLIGMAVTAVWMGALLPSWRQQAIREKEGDLIFRGEQYARAIALFYRKNQTLPPSVDILVSQHYLRRKYLDPITGKDFLPIAGTSAGTFGGPPLQSPTGRGPTPQAPVGRGQAAGVGQTTIQGGITGVRSTSQETSIRTYQGQQTYSQFPFDYQLALQRMGAGNIGRGSGAAPTPVQRGGAPRGGAPRGGELQPLGPGPGAPGRGVPIPGGRTGAGPGIGSAVPSRGR